MAKKYIIIAILCVKMSRVNNALKIRTERFTDLGKLNFPMAVWF